MFYVFVILVYNFIFSLFYFLIKIGVNNIMKFEHKSGIYICKCLGNDKVYIGQSKDVKLRKCQHLSELRYNNHYNKYLQNSYNKYGENSLIWDVLEYCDYTVLDDREIYWINYYDSYNNGFNCTIGGLQNRVFKRTNKFKKNLSNILKKSWENNDERRKNASERMLGENNPMFGKTGNSNPAYGKDHSGENNGMFGKHHSEESKELNRKAHLGKNNKNSKAIICVETQIVYFSQGEAKRLTGINDTSINKVCRGVKNTAGGYHWRYATQEEIIEYINKNKNENENKTYIA